ncbi:hypothetical protein CAEBREN_15131 [Caenorhabditis brenneri]|uniref:Uncharacterized protein n=1 Tax=Caenorhabditis brenneri TaxID=135651 RepID=G0P3W2_CAEBE|nr:hypothetical protein CAEBREN_15131 [Caenorhabditis brenneri]
MRKVIIFIFLVAYFSATCFAEEEEEEESPSTGSGNTGGSGIQVDAGTQLSIPLPQATTYRRIVKNAKGKEIEHLYRVCNGKNKKTCGYWENTKTKKKVASGKTTFAKNVLTINNIRKTDSGKYMTGNKKQSYNVKVN